MAAVNRGPRYIRVYCIHTTAGFPCTALHSQMNQNARLSSLAKFKCGVVKILVATDVASR